jgi:5-methylcytosine-specific restriction endonuclease McrA
VETLPLLFTGPAIMKRKKPIKKISDKGRVKKEEKRLLVQDDFKFYQDIWNNTDERYCYECGKGLPEPLSCNFHHILPKQSYPQFRHDSRNIAILCCPCHNQVETNIDKCPRTKELTQQVKTTLLDT